MARKQFVSSKKNAPSRAVSSKEAALHGRDPENVGDDDEDEDDVPSDADDASMNGGGDSPVSSAPSSPISSEDDDDDDDDAARVDGGDNDDPADADDGDDGEPVAVQVMPASVGRGKQLRFPTVISRGKEARMLHNGSDRDGSDSEESYASLASDEDDDADDEIASTETPTAVDETVGTTTSTRATDASPTKSPARAENKQEEADAVYPIKAFRARKRHRPDAKYFEQMSTHVRDCLLSIRDTGTTEALSEEAHHEFRRKLSAGTVERVPWKQVSPPPPAAAPSESEKKVPKSSPNRESEKKRAREEKDGRSSSSSKSSSRKSGEERSDRKADKSSRSTADEERRKERSGKENDASTSRREHKESSRTADNRESADRSKSSKSSSSGASKRVDENGNGTTAPPKAEKVKCEDVLCAKCKKSVGEQNADEAQRKASVEAAASAAALQAAAAQAQLDAADATAAAARAQASTQSTREAPPTGTFIVPTNTNRDVTQMREEAGRLNDEARSLKHEGNRRGRADPGPKGQVAQGRYFLRSSAKFFQNALLLADIKAAYREAGDERNARTFGDHCMQTLAQTSSLIESTVRGLRAAGNNRLVALGYKLTSIVEMTIHRLQHVKLFSLYSNLFTPGRSPDSRQNGSTPPVTSGGSDSQDNAVKALLLKEMEHTLRGFEMWQRYELCRLEVLPRITNPAVVDLNVLFEDLAAELNQS